MKKIKVTVDMEMTEEFFEGEGKEFFDQIDSGELDKSMTIEGEVKVEFSYKIL